MKKLLNENVLGVFMMVLTAVMFAFMAMFVRLAAKTIPVGEIVFVRYTLSTLFMLTIMVMGAARLHPVNHGLLIGRAVAAGLGGVFYFFAVSSITLAEAVILKYSFPLYAVTISALVFGERTSLRVVFLLIWSFAGIFIMMNPGSFNPNIGYLWGILNAVSAGGAVAFVRKLRTTDDSWTIMFYTSVAGVVLSVPLLPMGVTVPRGIDGIYLVMAGVLGIAAQFALVYGMRFIKTGAASVVMMLEVVVAVLLGVAVFGHIPGPYQIIGGCMILFGGTLIVTGEGRNNRKKAA